MINPSCYVNGSIYYAGVDASHDIFAMDTVNGNIIQSTRGIFSILFAPILAACGMTYLERKVSWGIIARRLVAACLMVAAIFLYNFQR